MRRIPRKLPLAALGLLWLSGSACSGGAPPPGACGPLPKNTELRDRALATCLADGEPLALWPEERRNAPVVLYVDRSGSMRGFLDPEYSKSHDYPSVIDRLIVALTPERAFGFGSSVEEIDTSPGILGNRTFYSDSNTELEDVLDRVRLDTAASVTHLIIGDGRRGSPDAANAQYGRMRDLAREWIKKGGTFLVAASRAPFKPVEGDPAGCRAAADSQQATCPLYAFAYVAPGDETRIVSTFAQANVFDHVFVWPLPAAKPTQIVAEQRPTFPFKRSWEMAKDGSPIARAQAPSYTSTPLRGRLKLVAPQGDVSDAAELSLAGQGLRAQVEMRPLRPDSSAWRISPAGRSLVRTAADDPRALELLSYGSKAERHLFRIELYPTGEAPWLQEYEAANAGDAVRTFGIGRLFELFRTLAQADTLKPVQRAYVVVN